MIREPGHLRRVAEEPDAGDVEVGERVMAIDDEFGAPEPVIGESRGGLHGGLMVCGTTSDAGKSTVVTGLCRALERRGVRVAPFKAQNMALNSFVTSEGREIGRAQAHQAAAARVEPEVAMNPILLKPESDRTSQVVVMGEPHAVMGAVEYHAYKPTLLPVVLGALADLRARFDVVVCEGAGSPTEINLLDHDIVNLRVAHDAGLPAIVVGDIDRGGVFAALYGTVALLPDHLRPLVRGFVINKMRGDPALLLNGCADLEARSGVPTLGVLPWIGGPALDAEDSLALARGREVLPALGDELDVAVIGLGRVSNFTDLDPLSLEPGVRVRFVYDTAGLGDPDLIVIPGSKATVADLATLRRNGLAAAIAAATRSGVTVLGICGGYQMLGRTIDDPVESGAGVVDGLAMLPVVTEFGSTKLMRVRVGDALGVPVHGYQIHHGRVRADGGDPFVTLAAGHASATDLDGVSVDGVFGTTLHGLFEADEFRARFLASVGERRGKRFVPAGVSFAAARESQIDAIADLMSTHLDFAALDALIASARPVVMA